MLSLIASQLLNEKEFINAIVERIFRTPISDIRYKQHEEKLINSDDFLNEMRVETPDVTKSSVAMLQKALTEESGCSISMEVLCHDEMGNLKKISSVRQVLFVKSMLDDDRFVLRIVTEARAGEPIPDIGILIS